MTADPATETSPDSPVRTPEILPDTGVLEWLVPIVLIVTVAGVALWLIHTRGPRDPLMRQLVSVAVVGIALIALPLTLPLTNKDLVFGLFTLVITSIIALSSTSFVANAMGGFMIRAVGSFKIGDFIRVGEHFGRVTEKALLHTEIQSEDRDLITLPNLHVMTQPVQVVRASGTIISADVSLGYDVSRRAASKALKEAAELAGLGDPFVRIEVLGDFSISYRVSGFLADLSELVSKRTELHARMLDTLHDAGIEIVSPNFMNQRQLGLNHQVLPDRRSTDPTEPDTTDRPEKLMFDKAETAAQIDELIERRHRLRDEISTAEREGDNEPGDLLHIDWQKSQLKHLDNYIERLSENVDD